MFMNEPLSEPMNFEPFMIEARKQERKHGYFEPFEEGSGTANDRQISRQFNVVGELQRNMLERLRKRTVDQIILKFCGIFLSLYALAACSGFGQVSETNLYTGVNLAIPDGSSSGIVNVRTNASQIAELTGVRVRLEIVGQYNGDLYVYLRHTTPQKSHLAVLLNRTGRSTQLPYGYSDDGLNIVLSDAATNDVHTYETVMVPAAGSPLTGEWQTDARFVDPSVVTTDSPRVAFLSDLNGMSGSGEWTLFVADVDAGGTNFLVSWGLELTGKTLPIVTWPTPDAMTYGAALTTNELNASASVPGTFMYDPPLGTVLGAGLGQQLTVTFQPDDTNAYTAATAAVSIDIGPQPLLVTSLSTNKTYGNLLTLSGTEFVVAGLTNNDNITNMTLFCAGFGASAAAGMYPIQPGAPLGNLNTNNYMIIYVPGVLTVLRAELIGQANAAQRWYGQSNPVFTATYRGFMNGEGSGLLQGTLVGNCTATSNSPVGDYPVTVSGQSAPNYTLIYEPGTLSVLPAPLLVRAQDVGRLYGQTNPPFGAEFGGFVNGEDTNILGGVLALDCAATTNSLVGLYEIVPSGLLATNYSITFSNGTLTVALATSVCTVSTSTNVVAPGMPVTFYANITLQPPSMGTPSGNARFTVDDIIYGLPVVLDHGLATLSTITLNRGIHTVNVVYEGDENILGSSNSTPLSILVDSIPTAANISVVRPVSAGASVSINYLLANSMDAAGGAVSFKELTPVTANGGAVTIVNGWIIYTPPVGNTNVDSITYTVTDSLGMVATGAISIATTTDSSAAAKLTLIELTSQTCTVRIDGIPWGKYTLQTRDTLPSQDGWRSTGVVALDATGWALVEDQFASQPPVRFYRAVFQGEINTASSFVADFRASAYSVPVGSNVTFELSINPASPEPLLPQGAIQFKVDGTNFGDPATLIGNLATFTTAVIPWGRHEISAEYDGDDNFSSFEISLSQPLIIDTPPAANVYNLSGANSSGIKVAVSSLSTVTYDSDEEPLTFSLSSTNSAEGGSVTMSGGWIYYQPPAGPLMPDSFTYLVRDTLGEMAAGVVNITPSVSSATSPVLLIIGLPNDVYHIQFSGVPWRGYTLQFSSGPADTNWVFLATCSADSQGMVTYDDTIPLGTAARCYRAIPVDGNLNVSPFQMACWTNFIALTNGRVMDLWSMRSLPDGWPAVPPLLAWNTNCLIYGIQGFTAISQCNQFEGSLGEIPATLITRRHAYVRGHSFGDNGLSTNHVAGQKVWFCTASNTIVEMTVAATFTRLGTFNGQYYDYGLILFTHDVPAGIIPMSVLSPSEFSTFYYPSTQIPYLTLGTEQLGHVATGGDAIVPFIYPLWKGGDSGSPDFIVSPDNRLVMFGGRGCTGISAQLAADVDTLTQFWGLNPANYQLNWYDLSPWSP
jgi:subtilisin-like proprotein convertase family protein